MRREDERWARGTPSAAAEVTAAYRQAAAAALRVADRELILVAGDRDLLAAGAMAGLAIATID